MLGCVAWVALFGCVVWCGACPSEISRPCLRLSHTGLDWNIYLDWHSELDIGIVELSGTSRVEGREEKASDGMNGTNAVQWNGFLWTQLIKITTDQKRSDQIRCNAQRDEIESDQFDSLAEIIVQ